MNVISEPSNARIAAGAHTEPVDSGAARMLRVASIEMNAKLSGSAAVVRHLAGPAPHITRYMAAGRQLGG